MTRILPVALQLYTLRHHTADFAQLIATVAQVGYSGVELLHDPGLDPASVRAVLEAHRVQAVSAHVPYEHLVEDLEGVIGFHRAVGNRHVILPSPPPSVRASRDPEVYRAFGRALDGVGARCAAAGLFLGYHNHDWEMHSVQGRRLIDWLLESAEPDHLFWEPDLAWVVRGGADPLELLARHSGRCPRVHVKDLARPGENPAEQGWADVGHGILDWKVLLPAAREAGAEWYIVEHDHPQDPVASVRRSLAFLRDTWKG